jgi:Xaa-Pro aminopeptidase
MFTTITRKKLLTVFSLGLFLVASAQNDLPADYLSREFHASRAALRQLMPANSVTVVFAYPARNFSNDVDYLYHQNPDMYYFSGYKEPQSMLLIFKDEQTDSAGHKFSEALFVQKRNAQAEQWTGRRLGTDGAKEKLGIPMSLNGEDFKNFGVDFTRFDKIIFDRLPADLADNTRDKADLFDLVTQFKQKAAMPEDYSKDVRFDNRAFRQYTGTLR